MEKKNMADGIQYACGCIENTTEKTFKKGDTMKLCLVNYVCKNHMVKEN